MPIKPESRGRYPSDWKAISAAIRERAQHRCEWSGCGARQYAVGYWDLRGGIWTWQPTNGDGPHDAAGLGCRWPDMQSWSFAEARRFADWAYVGVGQKPTVIVLTIAHLDHMPENCAPENLRAWCQRHHLAYDLDHHRTTAHMTRKLRAGTADLFGEHL